jgi:hypothetical protein
MRTRVHLPFRVSALAMPQTRRWLLSMQATVLVSHEPLKAQTPQRDFCEVVGRGPGIASHMGDDARSQRMRVTPVLPLRTTTASRTGGPVPQPHI